MLNLNTIYFDENHHSKVGLKLIFEEAGRFKSMNLWLRPMAGMNNVSANFTAFGKTFPHI
jgi:hypothetical protein